MRERLKFYRELGIGPLYRREVAGDAPTRDLSEGLVEVLAAVGDELAVQQEQTAGEAYLPTAQNPRMEKSRGEDREALLRVILDDIGPNCQRCKLATLGRKQIVFGTGDPHAELMFIGEGPGADEDQQGLPFVGRAGQLLNNMIVAMGLKREEVYIANIVKCRPPGNRTPERDECDTCSPFLMRQIRVVRPKVIVALGATAAKNLLGMNDSMAALRGRFYDFSPKGSLTDAPFDCKLAVTYHPAFLLRDPRQKKETWKDLQMVMKFLGLQPPTRATTPDAEGS
ncbi:MAG TPA: uracil-DNA glycosylase [Terriglobales bacterium]